MNRLKRIKVAFESFCGYLLLLAVGVSLAEIVSRGGFKGSLDLFFSFTVWISVWSLLLITGLLLPEGGHLSIDFIRNKLSGRSRWLLELILALITLGYGIFITYGSILLVKSLYQRKAVFPNYISIPQWMVELCVPIGMFIFTIYAVIGLFKVFRQKW